MSDAESPNGREADSIPEGGILAALPRARPQRASPRRAAARSAADRSATGAPSGKSSSGRARSAAQTTARTGKPAKANKPVGVRAAKKAAATRKPAAKPIAKPAEPPAPKQGYEPEDEFELGSTINPPSGAELVESVADIVGELANSGIAAGGRLLKDAFSLLRRP